ncbi:MAG: response regulator, partial [Pseudomonadales bacterium]
LLKPEKAIQAQPVSLSNLKVLLIHSSQDERLMDDLAQWELECELVADVQVLAALQPLESWDCVLAVVEDELGLAQQLTALAQLRFASDRLILLNRLSPLPAQLAVDKIQWSIVDYVNAQRGAQSLLHQLKRKIHASARQIVGEADYSAVRVLLVEDSPVNLQVTQGLLRRLGCRVHTACNGVEALQQWERKHWDLILMDIEMPVMDGVLATQNIRRRERERGTSRTPIIALTAHVMAGDRELYLTNDMDDFLAKPFSRDDLERVIVRWSTQVSSAVKISDRDIDTTVLDSLNGLKDSNGEPLLAPLIDSYLHLSTSIIEEMQLARQSEDVIQIRQLAKALKTSANHLGLQQVHWLSRKLESSSSGRHGSQLETDIVQLNRANRQACKALVSWRGR